LSRAGRIKKIFCRACIILLVLSVLSLFSPFIERASASISVKWTAPTKNTDGTKLVDLAGYLIYYCAGSACAPSAILADVGNITSYSFSMIKGSYCFAVIAYNAVGNQSAYSNVVCKTETVSDTTAPTITAFSIPSAYTSLSVPITTFSVTDNVGVTDYIVGESSTAPSANADGWQDIPPAFYQFTTTGNKTLYAWVKDGSGNISARRSASVNISLAASTNTISMTPSSDSFININSTNYAVSETLDTYTWPYHKTANSILMKFDLSDIPSGAVLKSATLYLYLLDSDSNASYPTYNLSLHRIVNKNPDLSAATGYTYDGQNSWTPNTYCYNYIPMAQADISAEYETKAIDKTAGFKSFDATQLIFDWLANPATNYGLLINADATKPADTYRTFSSSRYSVSTRRPYLSVTYYGETSAACTNPKFKVGEGGLYNYPSIQAAYEGLDSGDTLEIRAGSFNGNVYLNQNKAIAISGGHSCDFSSNTGYTSIQGILVINDGSLIADRLKIK
jgi:hypothetical protein